jgi:uncharacterized protein
MEEIINNLTKEVQPYFEKSNPAHDFTHTQRVINLALKIAEKEKADTEIVAISALLHDIARKEQDESKGKICHAKRGAEIAKEILKNMNIENNKIKKITHCIETHRFRTDNPPKSKEAEILSDADKLDAIGATGLGRAFSFSGHIGSLIHNPEIELEKTEDYSKNDTAYREFLIKLSKIKEKMMTNEGKKIAEGRHYFMETFFNRLNKEFKGEL